MKLQTLFLICSAAASTVSAGGWTQTYNPSQTVDDIVLKCKGEKDSDVPHNKCVSSLLKAGIMDISKAIGDGEETGIINKDGPDVSFVFHYKKAPGKFVKIDEKSAAGTSRVLIGDGPQHPKQGCVGMNFDGEKKFEFSFSLNAGGVTFSHDLPPCSG
jgi:hypothetical protein